MNDHDEETQSGIYFSLALLVAWITGILFGINIALDCF